MTSDLIASIIGYVLFAVSEILPLINVPTNGVLQSFVLGVGNAFKPPEKDIELADVLIHTKPELANIVNTISTNHVVQSIIKDLLNNPTNINNITAVQTQKEIATVVSVLRNNPIIKDFISKILMDPSVYNNVSLIINNPLLNTLLSNPVLTENPELLDAFKNPNIKNNIKQILGNPELSNIVNILANDNMKLNDVNNLLHNERVQMNRGS